METAIETSTVPRQEPEGRQRVSRIVPAIITCGLLGLGAVLVAVEWRRDPVAWGTGDALYDAIVARQLLRGEGLTTLVAPLGMLRFLGEHGLATVPPWLSLHKFPLSAIRVAAVFAVVGVGDGGILLSSAVFYPLNLILIYCLAVRLFGVRIVGVVAAVGYGLVWEPRGVAVTGLNLTFDTTLVLVAFLLTLASSTRAAAAAGLVGGLMFLHRYNQLPVALGLALSYLRLRRRREAACCAATTTSVVVLWVLANWSGTGFALPSFTGWAMVSHATAFAPYDPWYALRFPTPLEMLREHPGMVAAKWTDGLVTAVRGLIVADGRRAVLWGLAALGMALRQPPMAAAVGTGGALGFGVCILANALLSRSHAYALWALAVAAVWAGWGAWVLGRHVEVRVTGRERGLDAATLAAGAMVAFHAVSVWRTPALATEDRWDLERDRSKLEYVASRTPGDGILVGGNAPWNFAWYARRPAIPLPPDLTSLALIEEGWGLKIVGLYIPPRLDAAGDGAVPAGWQTWREAASTGLLSGFVLDRRFGDGSVFFLRAAGEAVVAAAEPSRDTVVDLGEAGDELVPSTAFHGASAMVRAGRSGGLTGERRR